MFLTPSAVSARLRLRSLLLSLFSVLALPGAAATPAADRWVGDFRRYAGQSGLERDSRYGTQKPPFHFSDLLDTIPAPEEWTHVRDTFAAEAPKAPEGKERSALQAGQWLSLYLLGERDALLAALPPALPEPKIQTDFAVTRLRDALGTRTQSSPASTAEDLKQFEQQIEAREPVQLEDVKRALGGEENFARFERLMAAGAGMQQRLRAVYEEYSRTKDEAAAEKQHEAVVAEFEAAHGADQRIVEPYLQNPLVMRYAAGLWKALDGSAYVPDVRLPDLVTLAGPEKARALLQRALALRMRLSVDEQTGAVTIALAREMALAALETLQVPSWGLAQAVEAAPLFEALQRRFPPGKDERDYDYQKASGYYLITLIQSGRVAEAVTLASHPSRRRENGLDLPYELAPALEKGGHAAALWDFLAAWLRKFPGAGEWDRFNRLSAQLGRQQQLKTMVAEMAADGSFSGLDRVRVQLMQADFELAIDNLAGARERLVGLLQPAGATQPERTVQLEVATKLLTLAELQQDAAGYQAVAVAAEAILAAGWAKDLDENLNRLTDLVESYNEAGRFADARRIAFDALERIAARRAKPKPSAAAAAEEAEEEDEDSLPDYTLERLGREVLRAEIDAGRWTEAAAFAQSFAWWGQVDVARLLGDSVSSSGRPLGWYFARLAQQEGKTDLARKILEAQLVADGGEDAVYESYTALLGQEAKPFLNQLAASDRYEERPLIWRAKLESDAGQWDAAIATLEQAIQMDPSDGEEGRGDRMRVYAYLSRAVAAKGDREKAAFLDNVVKSIRQSETADRWFGLGAYQRAITLYRGALGFFQDAYCIQSRLAVRLAGEGRMDEAMEHYRKAFELMPDSFGRVESHCFGCEHVFAGAQSQGVAEEVFTRMLAARPDKPQLHYLMGYLREEQDQWEEAAKHYRKAVQLDPLYLNAWKRLADLDSHLHFPTRERDDLALQVLAMDPRGRHGHPNLTKVSDLPRLWRAMREASGVVAGLPAPETLWSLQGAATRLAARKESPYRYSSGRDDFGDVLQQHAFVEALQQYLAALQRPDEAADGSSTIQLEN